HDWSASSVGGAPGEAWLECYTVASNGLSSPSKTDTYNVRAVRGGAAPTLVCASTPLAGCLMPGRSILNVHGDAADPSRDKRAWTWTMGSAVSSAALGDPTGTTEYALCVYGNGSLLIQLSVPPNGLWRALGGTPPSGYKYSERTGQQTGVTKLQVAAGSADHTR